MLYVSTRSKTESFTAHRALQEAAAPDGGMYAPFRFPVLVPSQVQDLMAASFHENVAAILNLFFGTSLTSWDIECCLGKTPCKIIPMNRRILVAETWHNLDHSYPHFYTALAAKLNGGAITPSPWLKMTVDVAVLFGLYSDAARMGIKQLDISVDADNFSAPLAALYARKLGLPVGRVICCLQENSHLWNFIHYGELSTAFPVPPHMELFLFSALGFQEVQQYLSACKRKGVYTLSQKQTAAMGSLLFPVVVGKERIGDIVRSVYRMNAYLMNPSDAMAYGGLQDFRAGTGESCDTMIFSATSPKTENDPLAIGAETDRQLY